MVVVLGGVTGLLRIMLFAFLLCWVAGGFVEVLDVDGADETCQRLVQVHNYYKNVTRVRASPILKRKLTTEITEYYHGNKVQRRHVVHGCR